MARYTDAEGREWTPKYSLLVEKLFYERTGRAVHDAFSKEAQDDGTYRPTEVLDLIWLCVERQARAAGIEEDDFLESLTGDAGEQATLETFRAIAESAPSAKKKEALEDFETTLRTYRDQGGTGKPA